MWRPNEVRFNPEQGGVYFLVAAILSVAALNGLWIGAVLGHLRLWRALAGWTGVLVGLVSIPWIFWGVSVSFARLTGVRPGVSLPDTAEWGERVAAAVAFMVAVGVVGAAVRWVRKTSPPPSNRAWRRRYNRMRKVVG
jgi:hypothetical protein